jgi:ubiquinone/menaquinone biosynthesis C-methylase UbiE
MAEGDARRLHRETGAAWNETARIYEDSVESDMEFLRGGGNSLMTPERAILAGMGSWCATAVHLQCAGGTDTLSLLAQGAREVLGVDISPRMIACARRKSEALGANASWHCCDVLETPHCLDGTADLVYTGKGALPWMMDIRAWSSVVARLLKGGGRLFVFEGHPLDWVWDTAASEYRIHPERGSYFSTDTAGDRWPAPYIARRGDLDAAGLPIHERQWTLGQIINPLIENGLVLEHFEEYPEPYWDLFPDMPEPMLRRLPHTFSLLMRKGQ